MDVDEIRTALAARPSWDTRRREGEYLLAIIDAYASVVEASKALRVVRSSGNKNAQQARKRWNVAVDALTEAEVEKA